MHKAHMSLQVWREGCRASDLGLLGFPRYNLMMPVSSVGYFQFPLLGV